MTPLSAKNQSGLHLVTNYDDRLGLPVDDDEVYEPFAIWLDVKLAELVDRWLHLASPNASRRERACLARRS